MRKITHILLLLVFVVTVTRIALAGNPPLVHKLPSGATLILVPVPEADYVTAQLFIDKRSFKDNLLKQLYVAAYLGNLEQNLSKMECVVRLFPLEAIPEFPYDPQSDGYLTFKASSIYFNENLKSILNLFLGKAELVHFPLKARKQIVAQARKTFTSHATDSIDIYLSKIRLKNFYSFVNSVSLRQNVYLYIAGNMDLFRTVKTALQLAPDWQTENTTGASVLRKNAQNWYWTFVFWKFSVDALKRILADKANDLPMRLYAPLTMNSGSISIWLDQNNKTVLPQDSVLGELSHRFTSSFKYWYRQHYVNDLSWMADGTNQQGFIRLLSTAYCAQPDILFSIVKNVKFADLKTRYATFLRQLHFANPEAK